MNYKYYKAASERTDEDERALIPPFEKTPPFDEKAEHEHDLEEESKRDYYEVDNIELERETQDIEPE